MKRKQTISFLLAFAMIVGLMMPHTTDWVRAAEGDGTSGNPFLVSDEAELGYVGRGAENPGTAYDNWTMGAHYLQTADITLDGEWTPIGTDKEPFTGVFSGGAYEISGLTITQEQQYIGLFGYASGAAIEHVRLVETNIDVPTTSSGALYVGGIVGLLTGGSISASYNTGTINAASALVFVGGIVGANAGGSIENSYNTGVISAGAVSVAAITAGAYAGGIVGANAGGSIENVYNTGDISAVSTAAINAGAFVGGIAGRNDNGTSAIESAYWNSDSNQTVNNVSRTDIDKKGVGDGDDTGTTSLTSGAMRIQTNFSGFDFNNIWDFVAGENDDYPILQGAPPAPTYVITVSPQAITFGALQTPYTQPAAQTVTITNDGTGPVTLTQPTATNYDVGTLSAITLATNGDTATFTVRPKANLPVETYNEIITINGSDGASATVSVSFTVTAPPTYSISASALTDFGTLATPYTQPSAQTVTITNTGTGPVSLTQPTAAHYDVGTLSAIALATNGDTATFTVQPKTGLPVGTYNESITISGIGVASGASVVVSVTFAVTNPPPPLTYTISASTLTNFGTLPTPYTPPSAQTVTITNTGTGPVTLAQPTAEHYDVGALSTTNLATTGATATFTVRPKANLSVGTYNETITVSGNNGASATVSATFAVDAPGTEYTVTVTANRSVRGTTSASPNRATQGTRINLTATAASGYAFDYWEVRSGGVTLNNEDTRTTYFTMPAGNVEIQAYFREGSASGTSEGVNDIIVSANYPAYGRVSAPQDAEEGERVDLRAIARSGFVFDYWEVVQPRRNLSVRDRYAAETRFTMPDEEVEIIAHFMRDNGTSNTQNMGNWTTWNTTNWPALNAPGAVSNWAAPEIRRAEELGLIPSSLQGTDYRLPISRAEFAGVAVRLYEYIARTSIPAAQSNPFSDTNAQDVLKALNAGIMNGVTDTTFQPNAMLDREQCAVALTRVFKRATMPGWTLASDARYPLSYARPALFADDADISPWARDSVYFMSANGIITGVGGNMFAPRATAANGTASMYMSASREQVLAIAVRMAESFR